MFSYDNCCCYSHGALRASIWELNIKPRLLAEDKGLEPSLGFLTHAFQTCALGRYASTASLITTILG